MHVRTTLQVQLITIYWGSPFDPLTRYSAKTTSVITSGNFFTTNSVRRFLCMCSCVNALHQSFSGAYCDNLNTKNPSAVQLTHKSLQLDSIKEEIITYIWSNVSRCACAQSNGIWVAIRLLGKIISPCAPHSLTVTYAPHRWHSVGGHHVTLQNFGKSCGNTLRGRS